MNTSHQTICPEFIEVLVNSLVLSGIAMDFAGTSRPVSGSEHCFSHALDFYSDTKNLHGIQVALGTISMLKLINEPYDDVLAYLKNLMLMLILFILELQKMFLLNACNMLLQCEKVDTLILMISI